MDRELIKIKFNLEGINKYGGSRTKNIADSHVCEIKINGTREIQLKVYFDSMEYLGNKVGWWHSKSDESFIKYIEVKEIIEPKNLEIVDFSNSKLITFKNSSAFFEDGLKYFTIKIDSIRMGYKTENNNDSEFYLNPTSFKLIESIYKYNFEYLFEDSKFKWEPIKKKEDPIMFHKISFAPEHNFYVTNKNEDREILIKKEPRFRVINEGLSENQIKEHIKLLCDLFSFYSQEYICYNTSKIYSGKKYYYELLSSSDHSSDSPHGMFRWGFGNNPLNLVLNVDAENLLKNRLFVSKIVSRFIYGLKTNGESRFMILYNILEQIRNEYITGKNHSINKICPVKEEFRFIHGKGKTDKKIRDILEQITEIIHEDDKNLFKDEIHKKVNPIKYVSQKGQFESFLSSISIEPSDFELDFQDVKNLRDKIFHGHSINDELEYLERINYFKRFPKFVGTVILKYFGIDDINNIELVKDY